MTVLLERPPAAGTLEGLVVRGAREAAGGIAVDVRIVPGPEGREEAFRTAARQGGLVLVTSDGFHEVLRNNAGNFRRTMFGCIDAAVRGRNVMSVTFADEQGAFLAGAAAAMATTRTGIAGINPDATLGFLAAEDVPATRSLHGGFIEGARMVLPDARIVMAVAGGADAREAAVRETSRILDQGADVVLLAAGAGNAAAMDVLAARGAMAVVLDDGGCGNVLLSVRRRADKAAAAIVEAAGGTFLGGEVATYDLANDGVVIDGIGECVAGADPALASDMRRRLSELRHELVSGGIRLRSLRERTLCDCQ